MGEQDEHGYHIPQQIRDEERACAGAKLAAIDIGIERSPTEEQIARDDVEQRHGGARQHVAEEGGNPAEPFGRIEPVGHAMQREATHAHVVVDEDHEHRQREAQQADGL